MDFKNPYNFIEKANVSFNLYLKMHDKLEKFIESYKTDQQKRDELLASFLKNYQEDYEKSLEKQEKIELMVEKLLNVNYEINDYLNQLKKSNFEIAENIKKLETNNSFLVDSVADFRESSDVLFDDLKVKQDVLVDSVADFRESSDVLFDDLKVKQDVLDNSVCNTIQDIKIAIDETKKDIVDELSKKSNSFYEKEESIKKFMNNQIDFNNNLKQAFDLFNYHYEDCKRYFFNNQEDVLKKYLDTDELFRMCYFNNIKFLSYSPAENRILLKTKEGIILGTNNRFYTIKEVIAFDGYSIPQLYQFDDFVVFDIGMNRGYSVLRFANFDSCSSVYGFEIDEDTYKLAIDNLNFNPILRNKIVTYNFGLSDKEENVNLFYLDGCDGLTTTIESFTNVQSEFRENKNKIKVKMGKVKKATDVIFDIIEKENITSKIVLKIDTEGSEYKIIADLINSGLIKKFDVIIGEGHKFSDDEIGDNLLKFGFEKIEKNIYSETYSFCYVKKEHFKVWPLKD